MSDKLHTCPQCRRSVTTLPGAWVTARRFVLICEDCAARVKAQTAAEETFDSAVAAKVLPFTTPSLVSH